MAIPAISFGQLLLLATLLRIGFFFFGLYQDEYMPVRYTDIDYLVFSDAAKYVYQGLSPYKRETYRYTPLLAWSLLPNAWGGFYVHFGKILFMVCDLLTGILIYKTLPKLIEHQKRIFLLAIWLLNPMVITISTRGSSESVLTCFIMLTVYYFMRQNFTLSALWLGLSIHLKIYPIIYIPAFLFCLSARGSPFTFVKNVPVLNWINLTNLWFLLVTLVSLGGCNYAMYQFYGYEFLEHSYFYHLTRIDHRHNFSLYNVMLYYASAWPHLSSDLLSLLDLLFNGIAQNIEKFAFGPQLFISAVIIPLTLAQSNLLACLFIQTFAFVTFNKVITSQYFIWFLIFLPHYLGTSTLTSKEHIARSCMMLLMWIMSQACWLLYAYKLEFLGESTFTDGLLKSSILFFLTNCYLLKQFIEYA
ncbi:hypothetical protein PUMCH_001306 [Australozyma saopauloensis]|uniref:GPI mannosyltransferase 1 n=1 Tax=Australozyma saopauloensis TaxID=291208 RepID=A0AAX4H754_9ASCO|nr:hypothetical protein PUMCH_001306 [[Candida] saopauloensis]